MTELTLEDLVDTGERHARHCLIEQRQNEILPFYHLVSGDGTSSLVALEGWANEIQKELMIAKVREIAKKVDAVKAMAVIEAWTLAAPEHLKGNMAAERAWINRAGPPSQHPHRQEVVMIFATDGERSIGKMLHIHRDKPGGRITELTEDEVSIGKIIDGRMADILPRRPAKAMG